MRYFEEHNGFAGESDFWGIVGLLHDVDFELFPEDHCRKASELLAEIDAPDEQVHAVCSLGWDITVDVKPDHFMEKVLYAVDELTGLIWAATLMRPSKGVQDIKLKSVKKEVQGPEIRGGLLQRGHSGWSRTAGLVSERTHRKDDRSDAELRDRSQPG